MASDTAPVVTPSTLVPTTPGIHDDLSRSKSLKRARETTPTPSPSTDTVGDISPSKIARLVGYTRQAQSPEDKRRRKTDEQGQEASPTSPNSTQRILTDLMSGATAAMNRPQDPRPDVSAIDAAAAATARALQISTDTAAGLQEISPESAISAESAGTGGSIEDGESQVVQSPAPMDVDAQGHQRIYAPQPEAQMEDKTATSLSYPGLPANLIQPPPLPSQRGMSMPTATSQNAESPSVKKHKCPYCETEFTRHHNLKSHLLTHSQEKPYVCQQCQMRFRRLHDLKRHGKLHTGEKPHICPKCDRKFARGDALARHSKGAGGCAGRRPSMGSFAGEEDFEGTSTIEGDDSAMSGVLYDNSADTSMIDEERRNLSMPSIKTQHVPGQENFGHSNTYPPAGGKPPAGGLVPPNVDHGSTGSTTSPSIPNSHTPHTSISSMPLSAGASSMYSQSGMTESPKPLSPGGVQTNQAGQKRAPGQLSTSGLSMPSHGMSPAAKQAWLSHYPPADGKQAEANAAPAQPGRGRGRGGGVGGAGPRQTSNGVGSGTGSSETGPWAYFQHMDDKIKQLTADLEAKTKREAEIMNKLSQQEQSISLLAAELSNLRQQLGLVGGQDEATAGQE